MRPQLLLGLALLAIPVSCHVRAGEGWSWSYSNTEKAERTEELPLDLAAGESLDVDLSVGDVAVKVIDGADAGTPRVFVRWTAHANDMATAKQALDRYQLQMTRREGGLSLEVVGEPLAQTGGGVRTQYPVAAHVTLHVPRDLELRLRTRSGDISATGPFAGCALESSYGDLKLERAGGASTLTTASGDVVLSDCEGESFVARSQYGDIVGRGLRGTRIELHTSSGDVSASRIVGALTLRSGYGGLAASDCEGALDALTSSGDIAVRGGGSAARRLVTSYGDIEASEVPGDLVAKTSSGDVALRGLAGSVEALTSYGDVALSGDFRRLVASTSSGDVAVAAGPKSRVEAAWKVTTQYGDVAVSLPEAIDCELDVSAGGGDVECSYPGAAPASTRERGQVQRRLGRGGAALEIHSSGGDVSVRGARR